MSRARGHSEAHERVVQTPLSPGTVAISCRSSYTYNHIHSLYDLLTKEAKSPAWLRMCWFLCGELLVNAVLSNTALGCKRSDQAEYMLGKE
jgi:hypothetical protein